MKKLTGSPSARAPVVAVVREQHPTQVVATPITAASDERSTIRLVTGARGRRSDQQGGRQDGADGQRGQADGDGQGDHVQHADEADRDAPGAASSALTELSRSGR